MINSCKLLDCDFLAVTYYNLEQSCRRFLGSFQYQHADPVGIRSSGMRQSEHLTQHLDSKGSRYLAVLLGSTMKNELCQALGSGSHNARPSLLWFPLTVANTDTEDQQEVG